MNLDAVFNAFVNPQSVLLCLGVWVTTYIIRTVMEALWKRVADSLLWAELFVPLAPILLGGGLGFLMKTFVWPEFVGTSVIGRCVYGAICGVFSSLVYGRVRSFIAAVGEKKDNEKIAAAVTAAAVMVVADAPLGGHPDDPSAP